MTPRGTTRPKCGSTREADFHSNEVLSPGGLLQKGGLEGWSPHPHPSREGLGLGLGQSQQMATPTQRVVS